MLSHDAHAQCAMRRSLAAANARSTSCWIVNMSSYQCPLCLSKLASRSVLMTHMRLEHADDPGFLVQCNLQGCKRTFRKFTVYRNHIYQYHNTFSSVLEEAQDITSEEDISDDQSCYDDLCPTSSCTETSLSLQNAAARTVLKISECYKIPQSTMDCIISDFQTLVNAALVESNAKLDTTLTNAGIDEATKKSILSLFAENSALQNLFKGLETKHKQQQYYRKNFGLVVRLCH